MNSGTVERAAPVTPVPWTFTGFRRSVSGTGGGGGQRPVYIYYYVTLGLTPGPTMTWCGGSLCHTCPVLHEPGGGSLELSLGFAGE